MPGLVGPLPNPDAVRPERHRRVPLGDGPGYHPEPLVHWRHDTVEAWGRFWKSDVIGVAIDVDVPSMVRLFSYYDLWTELYTRFAQAGDLVGFTAKGEEKPSPWLLSLLKVESAIQSLESRFGVTPYLRAKLGIKLGDAVDAAGKLNRPARRRTGADVLDVDAEPDDG